MLHARLIACLLLLVMLNPLCAAQNDQFTNDVTQRVNELLGLDDGAGRKGLEAKYDELRGLADYVSSVAGPRQTDAMVYAEGALGCVELLLYARPDDAPEILALLREHPAFMVELGLLATRDDNAKGVVDLAARLLRERPDQTDAFPALAAALCVVHDGQRGDSFSRRINENSPTSSDPLLIFDFFVSNARTMTISPAQLPALALVYVVDVTETPEQLQLAHNRYRNNPSIRDRFFEIEYDFMHFQQNKPKKVTAEPGEYNLEKIKRFGGVCADQAYYAMSVAKACGIPSAYVVARGSDVSHAWVGFVETRGRRAAWNFDAGRYEDYQNLRGNLLDPQSGKDISDGRAGVLGGAMSARNNQVLASQAGARVGERMLTGLWRVPEGIDGLDSRGNARKARTNSTEDQLALLRSVLSDCPGVPRAWDVVVETAKAGKMDQKQMDVWARAAMQLAGRQYQDFAYDFLGSLITTGEQPEQQQEMWEWAFAQFRARPDLAAGIRFQQGYLWSTQDNLEYAWLAYNDVVEKFINDGPMVVTALAGMQSMLEASGKEAQIIPVLEAATRRVNRPSDMSTQFATQSNFFRIHKMLADAYAKAGRSGDARRIRQQLGL